jgi:hypothetical protein
MKFKEQKHDSGTRSMLFECPGSDSLHVVYVGGTGHPVWAFNEDMNRPTISPSLLVRWTEFDVPKVCHSFINDGRIQFLSDCTHALANQTVDLPDIVD